MAATIFYQRRRRPLPYPGSHRSSYRLRLPGHAHALNLRDSGVKVIVGLSEGSKSRARLRQKACASQPLQKQQQKQTSSLIPTPDQVQARSTQRASSRTSSPATHCSSHTASTSASGYITAPEGVDVAMVAPKGPGHTVRREFEAGRGVPALVAVERTHPAKHSPLALSYAKASAQPAQASSRPPSPKRPNPTCSVSRQSSGLHLPARPVRLRGSDRGWLPARNRILRGPARAQAHR